MASLKVKFYHSVTCIIKAWAFFIIIIKGKNGPIQLKVLKRARPAIPGLGI